MDIPQTTADCLISLTLRHSDRQQHSPSERRRQGDTADGQSRAAPRTMPLANVADNVVVPRHAEEILTASLEYFASGAVSQQEANLFTGKRSYYYSQVMAWQLCDPD